TIIIRYRNFPKKAETTSQMTESIFAKIFSPLTLYKDSGNSFFNNGICFNEYKILLTRYVFFKENEICSVLFMNVLPQSCNNLLLKFLIIQIRFIHNFQFSMI